VPDPLDSVREAERLVREATERAEAIARGEGDPPPRGYDVPRPSADRPSGGPFPDLSALTALLDAARGALPPELARQLAQALRELLIAIRAVLDYSIERLGQVEQPPPEVEDIPIE
jgi:hypothetical protein